MQLFLQSAYLSSAMSLITIALLYHSHPFRRLPVAPLLSTFAIGMLAVVPVTLLHQLVPSLIPEGMLGAILVAPWIEESVKLLLFIVTVRRLGYPSLIEPLDYAIFFGVLGLGFGVYEDFWYIFGMSYPSWIAGDEHRFVEVFRWMAYARSFPGHVLFNAMAGFLVGWGMSHASKRKLRWGWFAGAFGGAVGAHSLFNLAASQHGTLLLWSVVILYVGIFLMLRRQAIERSPFIALQAMVQGAARSWDFDISPAQVLFTEGYAWPGKAKRRYLAFFPLALSLIVLFPVFVSLVYVMNRLLVWIA